MYVAGCSLACTHKSRSSSIAVTLYHIYLKSSAQSAWSQLRNIKQAPCCCLAALHVSTTHTCICKARAHSFWIGPRRCGITAFPDIFHFSCHHGECFLWRWLMQAIKLPLYASRLILWFQVSVGTPQGIRLQGCLHVCPYMSEMHSSSQL